jgi:hypothetical protein
MFLSRIAGTFSNGGRHRASRWFIDAGWSAAPRVSVSQRSTVAGLRVTEAVSVDAENVFDVMRRPTS